MIEPDSWDEVGGPGSIRTYGGILVVSHQKEIHAKIRSLLAMLRQVPPAAKRSAAILKPIESEPAWRTRIDKILKAPAKADFNDMPLGHAMRFLSNEHGVPILLRESLLEKYDVDRHSKVTFQSDGMPLGDLLYRVLEAVHYELTFTVRNEILVVTRKEFVPETIVTRLFPVPDFVGGNLAREADAEELNQLRQLIMSVVDTDMWDEVGGPGSIVVYPDRAVLVCAQTPDVSDRVSDFLQTLRESRHHKFAGPSEADTLPPSLSRLTTKVYFLSQDARKPIDTGSLEKTIRDLCDPESWSHDGVYINFVSNRLVVRQFEPAHDDIEKLLELMRLTGTAPANDSTRDKNAPAANSNTNNLQEPGVDGPDAVKPFPALHIGGAIELERLEKHVKSKTE